MAESLKMELKGIEDQQKAEGDVEAPPIGESIAEKSMGFANTKYSLLKYATASEEERVAIGSSFEDKEVRRRFMMKVYGILSVQLAVTFGIIFLFTVFISDYFARDNLWLVYVCSAITIITIFPMACVRKLRVSVPFNFILLGVFTLAESVSLGMVASLYSPEIVLFATCATGVIVFGLTVFAFQTKIDFTACRGVMMVVLLTFTVVGLAMIFLRGSDRLSAVYGGIGVLVFSLYLIMDTQLMMGGSHKFAISPEEYIFAALALYLDIIQIFLMILKAYAKAKRK